MIIDWILKWKKTIWWGFLLLIFSTYLIFNEARIFKNNLTQIDYIILIIWFILLLLPLLSEIDIAGIKIKKEIDSLKTEIKEQIITLRSDIHNSTNIHTNFYSGTPPPPSDEKLKQMEDKFSALVESVNEKLDTGKDDDLTNIPERNKYLFGVRFSLERELRRIQKERSDVNNFNRPNSLSQIARNLQRNELIDNKIASLILSVNSICNIALHTDENISDEQFSFAKKFFPVIMDSLKEL
jgi:hypothetical protein